MSKDTAEPAAFDLEHVYDDQIFPLMAQIIEICKASGMQCVASFCYGRDEGPDPEEHICTTRIPAAPENRTCRTLDLAGDLVATGVRDDQTVKITGGGIVAMTVTKGSS